MGGVRSVPALLGENGDQEAPSGDTDPCRMTGVTLAYTGLCPQTPPSRPGGKRRFGGERAIRRERRRSGRGRRRFWWGKHRSGWWGAHFVDH